MDAETRAFFEKYFGLIQQELERTNVRLTAIEDRLTAVEDRLTAVEDRLTRLESRVGVLDDRADSHEQAIASLRLEMRERFISTDEQLRTMTIRMQHFEARVEDSLATISRDVAAVREDVSHLTVRMKNVEIGIGDLNSRVDTLADDMRQRFRIVQERLGAAA